MVNNSYFALFDEMGVGKTKQGIDAQCILYERGEVNLVIVITPASVRRSWIDPYFGEIAKHCWLPEYVIYEYHSKGLVRVFQTSDKKPRLVFIVTNYEYVRSPLALETVIGYAKKHRTSLILDESSFIKNPSSQRTKACFKLRNYCKRVLLLNGTPMSNSVLDLFPQSKIMSVGILGIRTKTDFKATYCKMGGPDGKFIVGAKNIEQLQSKMKPYVLRRKKEDCLDLPEKVFFPIPLALPDNVWKTYIQMQEEAIVALGEMLTMAPQAIVRITRLAQITSGILGGLAEVDEYGNPLTEERTQKVIWEGKADYTYQFLREQYEINDKFRVIIWGRFRPEREILKQKLDVLGVPVFQIYGGVSNSERTRAVEEFSIGKDRPAILLAQQQSGGFGLNLVTAHNNIYMSNTRSLMDRLQSEDRTHRQGQRHDVNYWDLIATGPRGQRTIDHIIYDGLRNMQNIAEWTTRMWREKLSLQRDLYGV